MEKTTDEWKHNWHMVVYPIAQDTPQKCIMSSTMSVSKVQTIPYGVKVNNFYGWTITFLSFCFHSCYCKDDVLDTSIESSDKESDSFDPVTDIGKSNVTLTKANDKEKWIY